LEREVLIKEKNRERENKMKKKELEMKADELTKWNQK
jgi:hypothetical protein